MQKAEHISTISNKITVQERQRTYMCTRDSCSHFQIRHILAGSIFFILEHLSAYTIGDGGGELIKGQIRQEQRPTQAIKLLKILKRSYSYATKS